jgi:hypothetical protein
MTHTDDIETCRECEAAPARKIKALTESNRELLEALEAMVKHCDLFPDAPYVLQAKAAIAKARTQP